VVSEGKEAGAREDESADVKWLIADL